MSEERDELIAATNEMLVKKRDRAGVYQDWMDSVEGVRIRYQGNFTIAEVITGGGRSGLGVSKKNNEDTFDLVVGDSLAVSRALDHLVEGEERWDS